MRSSHRELVFTAVLLATVAVAVVLLRGLTAVEDHAAAPARASAPRAPGPAAVEDEIAVNADDTTPPPHDVTDAERRAALRAEHRVRGPQTAAIPTFLSSARARATVSGYVLGAAGGAPNGVGDCTREDDRRVACDWWIEAARCRWEGTMVVIQPSYQQDPHFWVRDPRCA
jgi:hypothetical protein